MSLHPEAMTKEEKYDLQEMGECLLDSGDNPERAVGVIDRLTTRLSQRREKVRLAKKECWNDLNIQIILEQRLDYAVVSHTQDLEAMLVVLSREEFSVFLDFCVGYWEEHGFLPASTILQEVERRGLSDRDDKILSILKEAKKQ